MKNLIMLLMVSFSFAIVNAQATTKAEMKTEAKSCSKDCKKACCTEASKKECTMSKAECDKSKAEGKSCDKTAAKKSCDKTAATKSCCDKSKTDGKSCDKTAATKSCCDKSKTATKSCSGSTTAAAGNTFIRTVNAKDFMAYAKRFPTKNIIDLRSTKDIKANGAIPGATSLDYNARDFKGKVNQLDKNTPVLVYCNSGKTSKESLLLFKSWGFSKVYNLDGGYDAYQAEFPSK